MNNEKLLSHFPLLAADWGILLKILMVVIFLVLISIFIYDRFIQRKNQLLINFPLIGRMRYVFTCYVDLCVNILVMKHFMILLRN